MNKIIENDVMNIMMEIQYGFLNKNNENIYENENNEWNESFPNIYYLLSPEELLSSKYGVCWDQVELERYLFEKENVKVKTFFICTYDNKQFPTHTFLTYEKGGNYYWFEHSWEPNRGIHEFPSEVELLKNVKEKFVVDKNFPTVIYEYTKPNYGLSCSDFYKHCESGKYYGDI